MRVERDDGAVSAPGPLPTKPTREEIAAGYGRSIPDVIAPRLRVLFCGINPGLYSGATGRHFARPGNRFWKALFGAGLTERLIGPWDGDALLAAGLGITNLVNRATATAAELAPGELRAGAARLRALAEQDRPTWIAVVGVSAYRTAFDRPEAVVGPQAQGIGPSALWVLPNPSGANASYQLPALVAEFRRLREAVEAR